MLLRSITKHVKEQNWFAVFVDFAIVVVGVFVGLQVSNWNQAYSDKAEYERALERLEAEINTNRLSIAAVDADVRQSQQQVGEALDILLSCAHSEANRQMVNKGLAALRTTNGIYLRTQTLRELTSSARLLAQQSPQERQRFTDMLFYFDLTKRQSEFVEYHPHQQRFEDNPLLSVGPRQSVSRIFYGVDLPQIRLFELKVPIDVACNNDPLIKAFVTWERWQGDLSPMMGQIHNELNATKTLLEQRK
ncbi:hypothetical protein [Aliiglaciecola litoralis]|uniref:Uncharacterized protein n=1 Tax=Aliiglaciecola litoralis TaxID=582857 RepID=A0ABN1LDX9_9ALTE